MNPQTKMELLWLRMDYSRKGYTTHALKSQVVQWM